MKIAVIADAIDDQWAGNYVHAAEFIRALERINTEHDLVYVHMRHNPFFEGLKEIIVPQRKPVPLWGTLRKLLWLPWILERHGFEVVHDLTHMAPFILFGRRYKRVVTIHDLVSVLLPRFQTRRSRLVHALFLPRLFRRADLVLTVSQSTKRDILAHYSLAGKVECVLSAPRTPVRAVEKSEARGLVSRKYGISGDYLLHVGTLEPRKNLAFLLDVFADFKTLKGFEGQLVLVGRKGWHWKPFQEKLDRLPAAIRRDVVLTGYVPQEDLSALYSGAFCLVYPSFYEGFGLPPLEAMKCGCPAVVAENSSLREVVGEGGMLLPLGNRTTWVEVIHRILTEESFRRNLTQAGHRQHDRFSWDEHARRVLALYEELAPA